MAKTPSKMIPLGTQAPDFCLPDAISERSVHLLDIKSPQATVIIFMCNHCPFVTHIIEKLSALAQEYQHQGIAFIGINSNDVEKYPDDAPQNMRLFAQKYHLNFPYLFDESQETAKAYDAACTPDFFIFDHLLHLVYRGQFDESRPNNDIPVTGDSVSKALDAILLGEKVSELQRPSIGCNIKWKIKESA
jgi:peroxiredoxin